MQKQRAILKTEVQWKNPKIMGECGCIISGYHKAGWTALKTGGVIEIDTDTYKIFETHKGAGSCQTIKMKANSGVAACLSCEHSTDWSADGSNGVIVYESGGGTMDLNNQNIRIRRLTPIECWRLQGFSDEQHNKAEAAGVSDSQRYKQAGNAISVNVAYAIGLALKRAEREQMEQ